MIIATDSDVKTVIANLCEIRGPLSPSLERMFASIVGAPPINMMNARCAFERDVGFVLWVPKVEVDHRLVAYVRPIHRLKGHGRRLLESITSHVEPERRVHYFGRHVWQGNDDAYYFWRGVGIL